MSGALVGAALVGCSPKQYFAQPASVEQTRVAVGEMKSEQAAMSSKIDALEAELKSDRERSQQREADLKAEIAALTEALERISGQLDDVGRQVERRGRQAPPPSWQAPPVPAATEPADSLGGGGEDRSDGVAAPGDSLAPSASGSGLPAGDLYDRAYRDVTRGNYDDAIRGFREFLDRFPGDDLADNAQYWLGECHYVQEQVPEATKEFERVLSEWPNGDKVPAAYLKLGYCALRQNDPEKARHWFDELIRKFPSTEEARSARNKLASIN